MDSFGETRLATTWRSLAVSVPLFVGVPSSGQAQFGGPASRILFAEAALPTRAVAAIPLQADRIDLRWPGTIVGGLTLGIVGGIQGAAFCGNSENGPRSCTGTTVGWALGGAVIGGLVGHFVGRLIRR